MNRFFVSAHPRTPLLLSAPLTFALGIALVGVGAGPVSASDASVQWSGTQLLYRAAAGEANNVIITQTEPGTFTITDSGAIITAGENCTVAGATATCIGAGVTSVQVELGDGDDTASVDATIQTQLHGEAGNDTLTAVSGPSYLHGGAGDDNLVGGRVSDVIYPGVGADHVTAGDGNDNVQGERADGLVDVGGDTVNMGAGDDSVYPGNGDQEVNGGAGIDSVHYGYWWWWGSGGPADLAVSLDGAANDGDPALGEQDNIHADVESLITGEGDDVLVGSDGANTLWSGGGNDVLDGAGGRDRLLGGYGDDDLFGGAGDDRLIGEMGADAYSGGDGDDFLDGSDRAGADTFNGGNGVDFVAFDRDNDVSVNMDELPNDGEAGEGDNVMSDVEDVVTGAGDDRIIGSSSANDLSGGAGNDFIRGLGGNDGVDGDLGRDRLIGGPGADSIAGGGNVDTISSYDRYADYVTCGSSVDVLKYDRHDQVAVDCETSS